MHILLHPLGTLNTLELSRIAFTNFTKRGTVQ